CSRSTKVWASEPRSTSTPLSSCRSSRGPGRFGTCSRSSRSVTPSTSSRPPSPRFAACSNLDSWLAPHPPSYDRNVVDVRTEIEIARPRLDVADYASNPDNALAWYEHIKDVEWNKAKPLEVGSRIVFVAHFLGKRLDYVYQVRALIPGERFVMATDEGPFPMETTRRALQTEARKGARRGGAAGHALEDRNRQQLYEVAQKKGIP